MHNTLIELGLKLPVLAAPMSGGPSTPRLAVAAARVGSLGFLAGGYKTPTALADQIAEVRSAGVAFGVNLVAPNGVNIGTDTYDQYRHLIQQEADRYQIDLGHVLLTQDNDSWQDKIDLLVASPVPVVSFTFGIPEPKVVSALKNGGSLIAQTVTSVAEARIAAGRDVDLLIVQGGGAGGHSGTFTPDRLPADLPLTRLVQEIDAATALPLIATGGLATPDDITAVLKAGAATTAVGTVLLRNQESGASATHRAALADPSRQPTVITRAFTGRPARALPNLFTKRYSTSAPLGYPALHHLTSSIRKAATAVGDTDRVNLWAGKGYPHATTDPAGQILTALASKV